MNIFSRSFFRHLYFMVGSLWSFSAVGVMNAQPVIDWDRTYGGDIWEELNSVLTTPDDGYLMAGFTSSHAGHDVSEAGFGHGDFWILHTDPAGDPLWDRRFGGDSLDRAWEIVAVPGGYLIGGESTSPASGTKTAAAYGKKDFWIVKTDLEGNVLWDRSYGGTAEDWLLAMAPQPDGSCLLGGWSDSGPFAAGSKTAPHKGGTDIWLLMIDSMGNPLWDRSYGGIQMEQLHHILRLQDGDFLLAGSSGSGICPDKSQPNWGGMDYWIIRIQNDGEVIWERTFGGTEEDVAIIAKEANNGDLLIGGGSKSGINGTKTSSNLGDSDYWMLRLNSAGEEIYQKRFGGGTLDKIYAIDVTKNDYMIVGGISGSGTNAQGFKNDDLHGSWDMWILYLDPAGNYLWDRVIGGSSHDALTDIVRVRDGSFALVGNSSSDAGFDKSENSRGMNDFWLVKTFCDAPVVIQGDSTGCAGDLIRLDATIDSCQFCFYQWSIGSHEPMIEIYPDADLWLQIYIVDKRGCESLDSFEITVYDTPATAFFESQLPLCFGEKNGSISLTGIAGGTAPYQYAFNNGPFTDSLDMRDLGSGQYPFHLSDANGCTFDTLIFLPEPVPFQIDLGRDTVISLGDSIRILPVASHAVAAFQWDPPVWDDLTPWVKPTGHVVYQLTAWDENGCETADLLRIFVRYDREFFAPNIFSPNQDGVNDIFTLYAGRNTAAIRQLSIYDRWGTQVFHSDEIAIGFESAAGWDGSFRGVPLPPATYIFFAEIEFSDGTRLLHKGDVQLVR